VQVPRFVSSNLSADTAPTRRSPTFTHHGYRNVHEAYGIVRAGVCCLGPGVGDVGAVHGRIEQVLVAIGYGVEGDGCLSQRAMGRGEKEDWR